MTTKKDRSIIERNVCKWQGFNDNWHVKISKLFYRITQEKQTRIVSLYRLFVHLQDAKDAFFIISWRNVTANILPWVPEFFFHSLAIGWFGTSPRENTFHAWVTINRGTHPRKRPNVSNTSEVSQMVFCMLFKSLIR